MEDYSNLTSNWIGIMHPAFLGNHESSDICNIYIDLHGILIVYDLDLSK